MMVQCYVVYAFSRPISWELGGGGGGLGLLKENFGWGVWPFSPKPVSY